MDKRRLVVDLFCEDRGHEQFARAMIRRLAHQVEIPAPDVRAPSARGGHGRALDELRLWQRVARPSHGDLLVVLIDANGEGWHAQRSRIEGAVELARRDGLVVGCPDPHVEAWIAADLDAVHRVLGVRLQPPACTKRKKTDYKAWLGSALRESGALGLTDPVDIALDVVPELDLFRAGQASPSLRDFARALQAALQRATDSQPPLRGAV